MKFTLDSASYDFSVLEPNEFGELVIDFNNIIDLPTNREYRIWIEFNNTWEVFDLTHGFPIYGSAITNDYIDLPCIGSGFTFGDKGSYTEIKCKFYPVLDNDKQKNSYIKVYGFNSP